jgi:hypothetical protein
MKIEASHNDFKILFAWHSLGTAKPIPSTDSGPALVQPLAAGNANAPGATYCQQFAESGIFIVLNEALFTGSTSSAPTVANNLFACIHGKSIGNEFRAR